MAYQTWTRATLMVAILTITACTANVNATLPGTNTGGGGGETAKAAIQVSEADPEVTKLDLGDLTPYRIECPEPDQANKTWIIFYFSAKTNKSYRCQTRVGQKVEFIEVTTETDRYKPGDDIDEAKWKVDSEQAKTSAVQVVQKVNVNINVTKIKVKNLVLVSAADFTRRTGTPSQDPVWVCTVDHDGAASPAPSASPSPVPSESPSASPSMSPEPSASPSASPSPTGTTTIVNNIIYINANNGNQINVNTGTQTNTTQTM